MTFMNSATVRMEDVVYTLNNIMDDIDRMYADSTSPPEDVRMEEAPSKQEWLSEPSDFNLPSVPSSPTLSSIVPGDMELDSDSASLYSSQSQSPDSTPSSSNLTTPSTSPTASTFLVDGKVQANASVPGSVSTVPNESSPQDSSRPGLKHNNCSLLDPSLVLLPASLACSEYEFTNNLAIGPFAHLAPSAVPSFATPSELNDSGIIYQTPMRSGSGFSKVIEPPRLPTLNPALGVSSPHLTMCRPALPPRPIAVYTHDPPPHLPALRSPIIPSTPKLAQSQGWDAPADHIEHSATYLRKQRQWVRMNISYGLPEPRAAPPFRPVQHHRKQYGRMYPTTAPLRSNRMGALNRRVNFAPKTLARGMWDPWRREGALERAILFQRRKLSLYEDMQPWEQNAVEGHQDDDEEEDSDGEDPEGDDSIVYYQSGESQEPVKEASDPELMRLCVANGKRVKPSPAAAPEPLHIANAGISKDTNTERPVGYDPETMRLCVRNGRRVPSTSIDPTPTFDSSLLVVNPQATIPIQTAFALKPVVILSPYAPRTQSPLSTSFVVPSPVVKAQLLSATDEESTVKSWTWRKFTSMVF